ALAYLPIIPYAAACAGHQKRVGAAARCRPAWPQPADDDRQLRPASTDSRTIAIAIWLATRTSRRSRRPRCVSLPVSTAANAARTGGWTTAPGWGARHFGTDG